MQLPREVIVGDETLELMWDRTDPGKQGRYARILDADSGEVLTDSQKADFPIEVDIYPFYDGDALEADIRKAFGLVNDEK